MADTLPTTDDLAKKASLPTTDELADKANNHGVLSGALSDAYFAAGAPNRILHAFSQGASQAWGAAQDEHSPETSVYRSGGVQQPAQGPVLKNAKEYYEGRSAVLKAANESWMRSAAHTILDSAPRVLNYTLTHPASAVVGAVEGAFGGISGAFHQAGAELETAGKNMNRVGFETPYGRLGLGTVVGGLGEASVHMGGVPMDTSDPTNNAMAMLLPNHPANLHLDRGRSLGAIGEPEGKYFGTVDLTARDRSARAEALAQTVQDTPDNIHEAARKYAPEAFEHYDVLQDHRQVFQDQLNQALAEQAKDPEYRSAQNRIDEILESVNHDESELTEERASELSQLRDKVESDSPAVADARKTLSGVEGRITDLSDHIHEAYKLASAGDRVLNPEAAGEPVEPTYSRKAVNKSAAELAEGEIAKDVEAKLLKAGRPADEAKIAGILYQQRYENRVARSPHLGKAEDLYKAEGPDILRGKEGSDGKNALNQYVGTKAFRGTKEGLERSKKLSTAVKMESAGKTPEQIQLATGWFRSPFDKHWRYEVSDKDASLTQAWHDLPESKILGETHEITLGEALKHDRLFEAYPEAKNIRVTKRAGLWDVWQSLQGSFDEKGNVLNLTPYAKDHLSTALHEIQHWIQSKEGFARGGSQETVFEHLSPEGKIALFHEAIAKTQKAFDTVAETLDATKKMLNRMDAVLIEPDEGFKLLENYRKTKKNQAAAWEALNEIRKEYGPESKEFLEQRNYWNKFYTKEGQLKQDIQRALFDGKTYFDLTEPEKSAYIKALDIIEGRKTDIEVLQSVKKSAVDLQDTLSKLQNGDEKALKSASSDTSFKLYRAIAGEVEARDTQARKDLTEEERHKTEPYSSEKYDPEDVLVHYGDSEKSESKDSDLIKAAKRLGIDHTDIPKLRELEKLQEWDKEFKNTIRKDAEEARLKGLELHEKGLLPFEKGTKFSTNKSREHNQAPWEVVGYHVDYENPDKYGYYVRRGYGESRESSILYVKNADLQKTVDTALGEGKFQQSVDGYKPFTGPQKLFQTDLPELAKKVNDLSLSKAHPSDWLKLIDSLKDSVPDDTWSQLKSWIGKEYRNGNKEITKEDLINHIGDNEELFQQKKGSLTLSNPRNVIRLFRAADASTFFHETGHQWLEELLKDAEHPEASPELKADLAAARKFLGNNGGSWTRSQHEKWARSFERYLREGHAPTKELKVLFDRFKEWLTDIYKTLRDLPNSKIDDSIRDVFDRLIVPERTRDVVSGDEFEQRQSPRQRERDIQAHIQEVKEHARTKQIMKFMDEVRQRAAMKGQDAGKRQLTDKRYIGPESDQIRDEGTPLPEPTPVESETGTAETVAKKGETAGPSSELKIKSGPLIDTAGNIRVENLTSDQDLADAIKLAYDVNKDELDKSRGKINSQATIDLAESAGIATKDVNMKALIKAAQNGGIPLSTYVSLLRNAFLESAKHLKGVMAGEDEVAYAEASTRHMALSRHLMGITAEWGRAGHSFRSLADEAREAQELNEFMQMSIGKSLKQLKREMKFGRYLDSAQKVSGFVTDMSKSGYGEWILEMYKNWLISGPITHMTYAVGNEIFALNRLMEAATRVGVSTARSKLFGEHAEDSHIGEVRERMYGLMSGHVDGLKAAWDSFKAGDTALLPGEERATTAFTQHRHIPNFKVGNVPVPLGSAIRLPSERMVAPLHSFARSVAFMEERNGLIYRKAYGEGLRGDELQRRIAELKQNVPVDITVAARAAASESALMGRAGEFTRKAVAVVNSELNLPKWAGGTWRPGGFIAPFITVSSNINRLALLERSPLGVFSQAVRDDISGVNGRFKQDVAISKMITGTAIGVAAGTLYGMEMANPAAPDDYKHATVLQAVNGLPHSIRIGEMSFDLSRLGVLGTTFSTAIDLAALGEGLYKSYDKGDHHIAEEAAIEWYKAMKEHLESEGFLSGISDLMKATNDGDRYGESWAKNFISSLVIPYSVGMSQIAQRVDPLERDTKGTSALESIGLAIRAKIPFESESLQAKVDLFGQEVPQREYWGVYASRMSQDPVWQAFKDVGYFPAPVKRTINAVKLTPEQYHDYATKAGITSKMLLDNVVNMEGFDQLDGPTKYELLKDAVTSGRQSAAEITKAESIGTPHDINEQAAKLKEEIGKTE